MKSKLFLLVAFVIVLVNSSRGQAVPGPVNLKNLIDSIDVTLNKYYVFPEKAKKVSMYLRSRLKRGEYKAYAST